MTGPPDHPDAAGADRPVGVGRFLHPAVMRSNLARSLDRSLMAILVSGILLAGMQLAVFPFGGPVGWLPALFPAIFLVYLAAGLVAWYRRPSNRMGALILVAGAALYLGGLGNASIPVLVAIGAVTATLVLAVTIHLLLAFPSGRLHGRAEIATVIAAYAAAVALRAPVYLFDPAGPDPSLVVAADPALARAGLVLQGLAGGAVMVATAVLLVRRLARATPTHRRVLIPLFSYGIAAVLFIALSGNVLVRLLHVPGAMVAVLQLVVVAGIPIAFVLGILLGSFARTGQLEELGTWLGVAGGERPALTAALAATLGDPSLEVVFWVPQRQIFVDADGVPVAHPSTQAERARVEIDFQGKPVAAISYNPALIDEPDAVRSAGRVVAIALERERLTAELRASRRALQRSRERLVDAADRARRKLAQDLHDGLQVQLVLLALETQQLANAAETDAVTAERATGLRKGIDATAAELRQLVQSVMPAGLVERGLSAATEDLVDRMPIPTKLTLDIDDGTYTAVVASTAYFVIAESLTNAVKHSRADSATVNLARRGSMLRVEVHDDGIGGATVNDGSGLRSLADRVDVLGGTIEVVSAQGAGTHIVVEVPCAS